MAAMNTGNQNTPGVMQQTQPQPKVPSTYQPDPKNSTRRRIPAVRFFGVFSLITAFVMCCSGIAAIAIKAKDSYVGSAIWTALLFLLPTGVLGLLTYSKTNTCSKSAYLVMNLLSCLICARLVIHESINAVSEERSYPKWICEPRPGYHDFPYYPPALGFCAGFLSSFNNNNSVFNYVYHESDSDDSYGRDYYDYEDFDGYGRDYEDFVCQFSPQARIAVDLLILAIALVHIVVSIVSMAFTCYGTCRCCYSCFRGAPPPAVVQYKGTCQLVSVGGYQAPTGFKQVSLMMPVTQFTKSGQVTSPPAFPIAPGQYHPGRTVIIPNSQTQITVIPQSQVTMMPENQMTVMPQHQVTMIPQNQATAMPQTQMPVIPQPFAPPKYQAADPLTSEQASNAVNSQLDGTEHTVPESHNVAYGDTTAEQFHDERSLLESV